MARCQLNLGGRAGLAVGATLTWTLLTQSVVMLWIREPDTPGGFINNMACRPASRSATADMMN